MTRAQYQQLPRHRKQQLEHESMQLVMRLHALATNNPNVAPLMARAYARHNRRRDLRQY